MFKPELASINNLSIGYIVTNSEHAVVLLNPAAQSLLAATQPITTLEEMVAYLPEHLAVLDHVKYCSVEHKSCSFHEVTLGDRKVRVFLSPIFEGEELRGNVLTLEDITDRINQEHARDQFLSFLVHELRTPLTAIRGNSELIEEYFQDALKDERLHEMVGDINSGSKYLLQMVNQFLDMARIEEGRIEYDLQQFDAVQVIRETVQSLSVIATKQALDLRLEAAADLAIEVVADPNRVKQVLTNLIGNGLKFTQKGGVAVGLKQTDEMLEVSVIDTGAGIPAESRAGMFQKYFQASNNPLRKDSAKSTGLGLYVTKLMVEGMGGEISLAKSEPGQGSTFVFTLTLATPARLKQLSKQLYDAKQGVKHAPALEHSLLPV